MVVLWLIKNHDLFRFLFFLIEFLCGCLAKFAISFFDVCVEARGLRWLWCQLFASAGYVVSTFNRLSSFVRIVAAERFLDSFSNTLIVSP